MSIINLGFQSVGLVHFKHSEDFEINCNCLKELPCLNSMIIETLQTVIDLLKTLYTACSSKERSRDTHIMLFKVPIMLCSNSQHLANYVHRFVPIMLA